MPKQLAVYKYAPTKTLLHRVGPIQCVRNCTNCIINHLSDDQNSEEENVIAIKSYDDLIQRKSLWLTRYQTLQYHPGQVDILKRSIKMSNASVIVYVVATSRLTDLTYLNIVLDYVKLPKASLCLNGAEIDFVSANPKYFIVPINMRSCFVNADSEPQLLDVKGLRNYFLPLVEKTLNFLSGIEIIIVPICLIKDQDTFEVAVGSFCVQIMEPYSLKEYLSNTRTPHKTGHLIHHIYHDLALYGSRLPCHIVAFLLLYLDRPQGVSRNDLKEYMDWFRESSMELNVHLVFTGDTEKAIEFALLIFEKFVVWDSSEQVYIAKNIEALLQYGNLLVPNVAYYGAISRAILMLHNRDENNSFLVRFSPDVLVKIMRDDLLELSQDLVEQFDNLIPCRRPCVDVRTMLVASYNSMQTFGKFFRTKEARARPNQRLGWLGDNDSDEEYFLSKRDDPSFKPWTILTKRPYRLDRLNLFMNAVEAYFQ